MLNDEAADQQNEIEVDVDHQFNVDVDHQFNMDMHINGTPGKRGLPVQIPGISLSVQLTRIQTMLMVGIVLL